MPRGKRKAVPSLSLAQLRQLVEQRVQILQRLQRREAALEKELTMVRSEIAAIVGHRGPGRPARIPAQAVAAGPKRRGRRGRGAGGLTVAGALVDIVRAHGRPMRVIEMAEAFKKSGHPTKSKNVGKLVAITIKGSKQFKRVGRGLYTAK